MANESKQDKNLSIEEKVALRRARVPIHEQRDKFKFRGLDHENYSYRLIDITDPDRVYKFLEAGWSWVLAGGVTKMIESVEDFKNETGSLITVRGGLGKTLGLVCLPKKIYNADQKAKQDAILEAEREMKKNLLALGDPRLGGYGSAEIERK